SSRIGFVLRGCCVSFCAFFCALFEVVYPPASRVIPGFSLLVCVIDFVIGFMIDLRTFLRIFQGIFQRIFSGIFTPFDATCKGL
ncbi:hypothetical protein ACJ5HC_005606, partial [Escherichia coli]